MNLQTSTGYTIIKKWFASKSLTPFRFQEETWQHSLDKSGLVNAPTGCGKTFSVFIGALFDSSMNILKIIKSKKITVCSYYG